MTLDEAINKFRDFAQGKGDFDELDLKEVIVDNRDKAVREALEKHHSAKIVSGKKIGKYEIIERINDKRAGHVKNLRVKCLRCGEVMYRTNNRLSVEHRFCYRNRAQLSKEKQD